MLTYTYLEIIAALLHLFGSSSSCITFDLSRRLQLVGPLCHWCPIIHHRVRHGQTRIVELGIVLIITVCLNVVDHNLTRT